MLLSLTAKDFVDSLGLRSFQAKKIHQRYLEFNKQLTNESGGGVEEVANKINA